MHIQEQHENSNGVILCSPSLFAVEPWSCRSQMQRSEIQELSSTGTKDKLNMDDIFINEYYTYIMKILSLHDIYYCLDDL